MKKTFAILMAIVFATMTVAPVMAKEDPLDTAIREASTYLNGRIPQNSKVAFINISGGYPDLADYVIGDLERNAVNDGKFTVVDRTQLEAVRAELNFNQSGEVSDSSAQAIGQVLGAQTIVTGGVRKIGNNFRLDVKAIEVQTAKVQGSWSSKNIPNKENIAELTKRTGSISTATANASGGKSGGTSTGSTTAAAAPADTGPTYKIGDTGPAGGLIFYDKGNNQGGWRYLEAAPKDTSASAMWSDAYFPTKSEGKSGVGLGKTNTQDIMEIFNKEHGGAFGWAAQVCDAYELNGFDDWFLPSIDELRYMYGNLQMKGLGDFRQEVYWSSTEYSDGRCYYIDFSSGEAAYHWKEFKNRVRAARRF